MIRPAGAGVNRILHFLRGAGCCAACEQHRTASLEDLRCRVRSWGTWTSPPMLSTRCRHSHFIACAQEPVVQRPRQRSLCIVHDAL